jgi:hypothetical protein
VSDSNVSPLLVIRVPVQQTEFNIDAIDTQIYCINTGEATLTVKTSSNSFITVDEVTGDTADDKSTVKFTLVPGEVRLISEIAGWEWDGHVGMEITCISVDGDEPMRQNYNFKSGSSDYTIESLQLKGRIVMGEKFATK